MKDDWDKPRGKQQHLTPDDLAMLRKWHLEGIKPRLIARKLQCSTRIVYRHIEKLEGRHGPTLRRQRWAEQPPRQKYARRPKSPRQTPSIEPHQQSEQERRASRFYRSNFEL